MNVERVTKTETEAALEARAKEALVKALPWLAKHRIEQQVTFTLRFGHAVITINGKRKEYASGRVDILVKVDDVPTIVLELKRPGLGITGEDVEQGLSYARVLHPRPPLVLATDGEQTRIVETHTGDDWTPINKDEEALRVLLTNVALVAADDMKRAVSKLLGNDPTMWVKAASAVSESFVGERMGDWSTPDLPFVKGFLLPRRAVANAIASLDAGSKLVLIEGGPLAGKSSALRELADALTGRDEFAVMLLDADSGMDLFTTLADIWSTYFSWPLTPFEARHWVQQMSRATGPALVLAIDDFDGMRGSFRRDLEALTSELFGDRIRVVLAIDEGSAQRLSIASNGRTASTLRRRGAESFVVGKIDDGEFANAKAYLESHGVGIMPGGEHTPELRLPWVLRAMCSEVMAAGRPSDAHFAMLPSVPNLNLLRWLRRNSGPGIGSLARYRDVAQALIADTLAGGQSVELRLDSLDAYLVRREALREQLGDDDIREMLQTGLLREGRSEGGEAVFIAQFPTVLASELARVIAVEIADSKNAKALAETVTRLASSIPLGPVVVTMAIVDAAKKKGTLDFGLFQELMASVPQRETLPLGTTFALRMPNGAHIDVTVGEDRLDIRTNGETSTIDLEGEALESTTANLEAWMILSHLATLPIAVNSDEPERARLDVHLLLTIGSYSGLLVEVAGRDEPLELETHGLPGGGEMICSSMGIVEPITFAIYLLFQREPELAKNFLNAALEKRSLPLMLRINTALRVLQQHSEEMCKLNHEIVLPAIEVLMQP